MKRLLNLILAAVLCLGLCSCGRPQPAAQIAATTLPVYEFTSLLCEGTGIRVTRLITESVSCLHDYSLQVNQMRAMAAAELIVISGAGLEDFWNTSIHNKAVIDSSAGIELLCREEGREHEHEHDHEHNSNGDPHIWLSPANAMQMAANIYEGLVMAYPEHTSVFKKNLNLLNERFTELSAYGKHQLADLSCRELVTFHDGFAYMAAAFDLQLLHAIEEESGSEASAAELKELIGIVEEHSLQAIFTEVHSSPSAASVISAETGAGIYTLDMAMGGDSYFAAMYHNIDVLKEALG